VVVKVRGHLWARVRRGLVRRTPVEILMVARRALVGRRARQAQHLAHDMSRDQREAAPTRQPPHTGAAAIGAARVPRQDERRVEPGDRAQYLHGAATGAAAEDGSREQHLERSAMLSVHSTATLRTQLHYRHSRSKHVPFSERRPRGTRAVAQLTTREMTYTFLCSSVVECARRVGQQHCPFS